MLKTTCLTISFLLIFFAQSPVSSISHITRGSYIESSMDKHDWSNISLLFPDQYHNPAEVYEELEQMLNTAPEIVDLFSIGQSVQGREIYCVRITNEQNSKQKAGALFIGQHHAREQITTESCLRFLLRLINNYGEDSKITEYINTEEIYVIPSLNPDGLQFVVGNETLKGNEHLRKNLNAFDDDNDGLYDEDSEEDTNGDGFISEFDVYKWNNELEPDENDNKWDFQYFYLEGIDNDGDGLINEDRRGGVDLNRNYDYRWNDSTIDSGWGTDRTVEDYPGTSPFSEPETAAYRDFVSDRRFATALSLHSGINATYFPWGSDNFWPENALYYEIYSDMKDILPPNYLSVHYGSQLSNVKEDDSYTVCGDWGDWMYARQDCLVPLTFEIYHNKTSTSLGKVIEENNTHRIIQWDGMYGYFAPTEGPAIDDLWEDIQPAFDYWLELTPRIEIAGISLTGGKNTSETLNVKLEIKNLSPRIGTIDTLEVMYEDNTSLLYEGSPVTVSEVEGDSTASRSFSFILEEDLTPNSNITLKIGNAFVGFQKFIIFETDINARSTPIGLITQLIAIPAVIFLKKLKKRK